MGSSEHPRRGALKVALLVIALAGGRAEAGPLRPSARKAAWWLARHRETLEAPERRGARLVFLGDSITQGWRSLGQEVWARAYASRGAFNLGVSGDRARHVLWRLQHGALDGLPARVVVIQIGTNDAYYPDASPRAIADWIGVLVREVRNRLPRAHVLLLGVFPSGSKGSARRAKLAAVNRALAGLHDGSAVHFLDLGSRLVRPSGSLGPGIGADALHLTPRGYEIWAKAMEPVLRKLLGSR